MEAGGGGGGGGGAGGGGECETLTQKSKPDLSKEVKHKTATINTM